MQHIGLLLHHIIVLNTEKDIMKKIYRPLIKGTNWALAGLLGLLGFTACEGNGDDEVPAMYGTPIAKYTIKGSVTDEKGMPIEGIGIYAKHSFTRDTIYTKKDGGFETTFKEFPDDKFKLMIEDMDAEKNGLFKNDSVIVTFTKEDYYENGKGWYEGAARKEIPPVVLKEKTDE